MTKLTKSELMDLATHAGFSGDDIEIAACIALAESGGDPDVLGDMALGVSVGLWQINLRWHPEFFESELFDPQFNANAAYHVYSFKHSFAPWTTFRSSAYTKYLDPPAPGSAATPESDDPTSA